MDTESWTQKSQTIRLSKPDTRISLGTASGRFSDVSPIKKANYSTLAASRPLLVGHWLAGRVRESHSRSQQLLVELLADVRREGQQVVAEIIGNDLQGDGLDEVVAEVVLLDLRDELDDS